MRVHGGNVGNSSYSGYTERNRSKIEKKDDRSSLTGKEVHIGPDHRDDILKSIIDFGMTLDARHPNTLQGLMETGKDIQKMTKALKGIAIIRENEEALEEALAKEKLAQSRATFDQPRATSAQPRETFDQPRATFDQYGQEFRAAFDQPRATSAQPRATFDQPRATFDQFGQEFRA